MTRLPHPVDLGQRQRAPIVLTGKSDATGRAVLATQPVPAGYQWLIDYVTVATEGAACSCQLYDSTEVIRNLIDGTATLGNGGVAAYVPPRPLAGGSTLLLVWAGAGAGVNVAARIEYHDQHQD